MIHEFSIELTQFLILLLKDEIVNCLLIEETIETCKSCFKEISHNEP